jgi:hypothetical protein
MAPCPCGFSQRGSPARLKCSCSSLVNRPHVRRAIHAVLPLAPYRGILPERRCLWQERRFHHFTRNQPDLRRGGCGDTVFPSPKHVSIPLITAPGPSLSRVLLSISKSLNHGPSEFHAVLVAQLLTRAQLVAIWLLTRYIAAGNPPRVRLVELGPGRGTLMDDILRVSAHGESSESTRPPCSLPPSLCSLCPSHASITAYFDSASITAYFASPSLPNSLPRCAALRSSRPLSLPSSYHLRPDPAPYALTPTPSPALYVRSRPRPSSPSQA